MPSKVVSQTFNTAQVMELAVLTQRMVRHVMNGNAKLAVQLKSNNYNLNIGVGRSTNLFIKMLKYLLQLIFIFFITSACSNKRPVIQEEDSSFKLSVEDGSNIQTWNFERNYIGTLHHVSSEDYQSRLYKFKLYPEQILGINTDKGTLPLFDKQTLEFIKEFGEKGEGPKENGRVKDILLSKDTMYIADNAKGAVKSQTTTGELIQYFKLPFYFFSASYLKDGRFVVSAKENGELGFYFVNIQSRDISKFHRLPYSDNVQKKSLELVFGGDFVYKSEYDFFYYYGYHVGVIYKYDLKGNLLEEIKTIDETPPPKPYDKQITADLILHEIFPPNVFFMSSDITGNQIFHLSELGRKGTKNIDIYNSSNGKYNGSILLQGLPDGQLPEVIQVEGNLLYILFENSTLAKYEIQFKKNNSVE